MAVGRVVDAMLSATDVEAIQALVVQPLAHRLLIAHPLPTTSPDATGQLFTDATGQPIGDATTVVTDWDNIEGATTEVRAYVEERTAKWPDGPGAGAELVDTRIWIEPGAEIRELDQMKWLDTGQAYQAVFVHTVSIAGVGYAAGLIAVQARRIPL